MTPTILRHRGGERKKTQKFLIYSIIPWLQLSFASPWLPSSQVIATRESMPFGGVS
jgi:hypothetical protein